MITEVILFHAGLASPSVLHGSARNSKSGADPDATLMSSASMADGGGGKLAVAYRQKSGEHRTRGHPRMYPTGNVGKDCNENRRSQPSTSITT